MIPELNPAIDEIPEALSIYLNQIVYDKKQRGERVYTFSLGEAFFKIPRYAVADAAFEKGYHYSSSMGQPALRSRIAEMYSTLYGVNADPQSEILISAGSKVVIYMMLRAILSVGDEVIVPEPAWLSYKEQIKLACGVHVPVPYDKTVAEWEQYVTPKTKAVIINNPNNPSGQLYSRDELEALLDMARRHNFFVFSDEAYSDFLFGDSRFISVAAIDESKENSLVVNSLSKNMGMSGWRVGYAIAHRKVIGHLLKLNQHLITCAATVLQDYMAEHFHEILGYTRPQAGKMAEKRAEVQHILDRIGISALKGAGTFYFLLDVSSFAGSTDELVYELLLNHNISTVPGAAYGESTKGFIRFGIGIESLEDIEKCLRVIKSYLDMPSFDNKPITSQMLALGIAPSGR